MLRIFVLLGAMAMVGSASAQVAPNAVAIVPVVLRAYGVLAVTTSFVAVTTATAGSNSGAIALPFSTGTFTVYNRDTSTGNVYVCPLGGTCTSSNGYIIVPGSARSWNIGGVTATVPTVVADSTSTVEISQ